jgi:hypothetical protein
VAGSGEKRRKPSWLILSLGFGGLLVCIVAAGAGTLFALQRVRNSETQLRKEFLARLGALDQIRAQIYLSGTYVRDFLLSPDPHTANMEAEHLAALERGRWRPRSASRFLRFATRLTPTGGYLMPRRGGRRRNGSACDPRSSTTNWSRGALPCFRSQTVSPR